MICRRIGEADWRAFKEIRLEALQLEPQAFASTYAQWNGLDEAEWRRRTQSSSVYLAFEEATPVAIMGLWPQPDGAPWAIVMVYVKAAFRRTGAAAQLLNFMLQDAASAGLKAVQLHVEPSNAAAIRFYQKHGFSQTGTAPRPDGDSSAAPDLVMSRTLSA